LEDVPMRTLAALLFFVPLTLAQPPEQPDPKPKEPDSAEKLKAEMKWAKGVAQDFFEATRKSSYIEAIQLLTSEYRTKEKFDDAKTRLDKLFGQVDAAATIISWIIKTEELSPDGKEAVFKGPVTGIYGNASLTEAELTIRVEKEKDSGKWRITFLHCGDFKKKDAPKK
jgi:hypothetical protein